MVSWRLPAGNCRLVCLYTYGRPASRDVMDETAIRSALVQTESRKYCTFNEKTLIKLS